MTPPLDFHFSTICPKSCAIPDLMGRFRAFKSAWELSVDQRNFAPSRYDSTTSENIGGILGARAFPSVDTVTFTPPNT